MIKDQALKIIVLKGHADVFVDQVWGLLPRSEVDFPIELVPRAEIVSKAPYIMGTSYLLELKMQIHEVLDKCYIRHSVPPQGALVLFVKKYDTFMLCI